MLNREPDPAKWRLWPRIRRLLFDFDAQPNKAVYLCFPCAAYEPGWANKPIRCPDCGGGMERLYSPGVILPCRPDGAGRLRHGNAPLTSMKEEPTMAVPSVKKPAPAPAKAAPAVKKPAPKPAPPPPAEEPEIEVEDPAPEEAPAEEEVAAEEEPAVEESESAEDVPAPAPVKKAAPAPMKAKPPATKAAPAKPAPKPAPQHGAVEEVGWDDNDVSSGGEFLRRYKGKKGFRDRIRIMPWIGQDGKTKHGPVKVKVHYNQPERKYANCTQAPDCPACEAWGTDTASTKFAVPIIHIYRAQGTEKEEAGELLNWTFGNDKYISIRDGIYPECVEQGKKVTGMDIMISCADSDKQKLTMALQTKSALTSAHVQTWKDGIGKFKAWIENEFTTEAVTKEMGRKGKGKGRGKEGDVDPFAEEDAPVTRSKGAATSGDAESALDDLVAGL